jgi:pyruvate dehydrogenase E2 component (dihydrolipoamide acetyltransferase)
MPFEFRLPDIGEGVAEGEVVQWFVKEGDAIREDQPLVSVLTDKANVEIPSPKTGRVTKIHAAVGEKVKVGGLLVTIEPESSSSTGSSPGAGAATPPSASPPTPPPNAPGAPPGPAAKAVAQPPPVTSASLGRRALASPYVRRLAAERGIDLTGVRGSGPGGRIVEADLAKTSPSSGAVASRPPTESAPAGPSRAVSAPDPATPPVTPPAVPAGEIRERIPIRGLRRVIAEHMSEATHRAAHYTYVEEVDVGELVHLRERMAKSIEKRGVQLRYLPFILKAVVAGLREYPRLNSTMDDAHQELLVRSVYHLGIATATPEGLIVPVLRDADKKSVAQIAREIQELSDRGRAGKLTRHELTGSTFTITSLGTLGGILATPILNYPEVAILGVHRIQTRPVILPDGSIGPGQIMNLSVSLDHRVIDGYEGAQFLAAVKGSLEDPHQLLADLA